MNLSTGTATAMLNAWTALYNAGSLKGYQGVIPASPETAISSQTLLSTHTFSGTAFGANSLSGGLEQETASFANASVLPSSNGTICFMRALKSDGTTVISDHIVAAPWVASTPVIAGQNVTNSGNLYTCTAAGTTASSGGPTGTAASISDGTATWKFVSAGSADVSIGNTGLQTTINFTLNSFTLGVPAV